jgi:hypothetical protein
MMRRRWILVFALFAAGCLKVEQCPKLLPVAGEKVSLVTTPVGKTGCKCMSDGAMVVVQPERAGLFGWKRGQIWIDGAPVTEAEFENKLAEAKAKHAVESAIDRATAIGKGFLDAIRK